MKTISKYVKRCREGCAKKPQQLAKGIAGCRQDKPYRDYKGNLIPTSFFIHHILVYAMRLV